MDELFVKEVIDEEDTQKGRFLTFFIGDETYGIEIKYVIEIIGIQIITQVPELPDYISGIINLRGKIIPVMDVRTRFKKMFREYNDRTCIIVVDINNMSVGLIVDSVSEVIAISDEDITPPPPINKTSARYIEGIATANNEVKLLLDCNKLISEDDSELLNNI